MPVNAIAMPFSFAAAIDSSSLIDPPRLETGIRLVICDSLSLATVVVFNDLGASFLESQNLKPDPVWVSSSVTCQQELASYGRAFKVQSSQKEPAQNGFKMLRKEVSS